MKDNFYYSTGKFAKRARVSIRTVRYYDKQGLLKPCYISEAGYRFYTDTDFGKLQKIIFLKSLGFSLDEIKDLTGNDTDQNYIKNSFRLQLDLIRKKIQQFQLMEKSIKEASKLFSETEEVDWNRMIQLIHITNMEKDLTRQYKDSANVNSRILLHRNFSINPLGWYQWLFTNLSIKPGENILEIGCGNGELWRVNQDKIPADCSLLLSDISVGMLSDANENLRTAGENFKFAVFDCHEIPSGDSTYNHVIGNHMVFYLKDRRKVYEEIRRVLKKDGYFYCSTYGRDHMKEIEQLVKEFDPRISLSEINLYEIFGLENGLPELLDCFSDVEKIIYNDCLIVNQVQPLYDYILSCHGNQQEYLKGREDAFKQFLSKKIQKNGSLKITKMAGIFRCKK